MKSSFFRCFRSRLAVAILVASGLLLGGCKNIFVAKHKVLVDAISAPGTVKPSGLSYRLMAKRSVVSGTPVQIPVVKACVDAALTSQGMFEAPANAAPDLMIEVGFGREAATRIDPSARETYLQLSARSNPDHALDKATGPEVWDVRVAVLGVAGAVESAMPLLSAVAATYLATDTRLEAKIDVPQNAPIIEAVRLNAIKILDSKGQPAGPTGTPAASAGTGAGTGSPPAPGTVIPVTRP